MSSLGSLGDSVVKDQTEYFKDIFSTVHIVPIIGGILLLILGGVLIKFGQPETPDDEGDATYTGTGIVLMVVGVLMWAGVSISLAIKHPRAFVQQQMFSAIRR